MKKILIAFFAVALSCSFAATTMAEVKVGGIVFLDSWVQTMDKENAAGGDDISRTQIQIPNISRFYGKWNNDANDAGMHIEFGYDGNGVNERGIITRHAYGWWHINDLLKLTAGQTTTGFAPLNPHQYLGLEAGRLNIIGAGFGNLHSGRVPQVRIDSYPTEDIRLGVALVDPTLHCVGYSDPSNNENETVLPRIDISADIKVGPVTFYPGVSYGQKSYDDIDDDIQTYAVSLGAKAGFGAFGVAAEFNMGQNWANQEYHGIGLENTVVQTNTNAGGYIALVDEDSDMMASWVDVSYKFDATTAHFIYGIQKYDVDGYLEQTTMMYGVSVPTTISKNLVIRPEFMIYDLGEQEGSSGTGDRGTYSLAGVQFQFMF